LQVVKRIGPAGFFPGDAADFELEVVAAEGIAEVATIFFDGVGGFVFAAEEGDEGLDH
jgi:hypothetical protein